MTVNDVGPVWSSAVGGGPEQDPNGMDPEDFFLLGIILGALILAAEWFLRSGSGL